MPSKVPTEAVVAAYRETGSVWKAGKLLGLAGQSVHERLVAVGHPLAGRHWTDDEDAELRALIEAGLPMSEIARRLGRPFAGVAGRASGLGVRVRRNSEVKLPRGAGFDKRTTLQHLKAIALYEGTVTQYARANGMRVEYLVQAFERHFPELWTEYVARHSDLPQTQCGYCERDFIPNSARQRFCSRKCSADGRADKAYFAGNRRHAAGMDAGICQLCGKQGKRGLSAHHIIGVENDPDATMLVALCPGCHKLVTMLGGRKFVDDPGALEGLLALAWMRYHGADVQPGEGVRIYVSIDHGPEADV